MVGRPLGLVLCSDAERLASRVRDAAADIEWRAASSPEAALAGLDAAPDLAFCIRDAGFDAAFHARLAACPSLRFLQVGGSGVEHLPCWDAGRLTVANAAGVLAPILAETCLGAMIALSRRWPELWAAQAARVWRPLSFETLSSKTLLIVGAGEIGGRFGQLARGLGMRVIGLNRAARPSPALDESRALSELERSLGEADVVSLHLRAAPETRGLFDASRFAQMKPGALLLNSARGALLDEAALAAALETGHLGGAWLDVADPEPPAPESPLWTAPRLMLSPHCGDRSVDHHDRLLAFFIDNVGRWRRGERLVNVLEPLEPLGAAG